MKLIVRLVNLEFGDRNLPEELVLMTMVLLPKGKGEYQAINIVEVMWKVCAAVVNCHLKRSVELNDTLHKFREGRGKGTANLEAKLTQQLVGIAHKPIFQFFLDVYKAYESLDRGRCLEILRGYGLGMNIARLITNY